VIVRLFSVLSAGPFFTVQTAGTEETPTLVHYFADLTIEAFRYIGMYVYLPTEIDKYCITFSVVKLGRKKINLSFCDTSIQQET